MKMVSFSGRKLLSVALLVMVCVSLNISWRASLYSSGSFNDEQGMANHQHSPTRPSIQVAVTTTIAGDQYRERLAANAKGWYLEFPDILVYTFDIVEPTLSHTYKQVHKAFEDEPSNHTKNTRSNLQLAIVGEMYRDNPNADFYLIVDDDTTVVPVNLHAMVEDYNLDPHKEIIMGKCVYYQDRNGRMIRFVVGGGGIFMSRALVKALAPHIVQCRHDYKDLRYGDARIGACIDFTLNHTTVLDEENQCADYRGHYKFSNENFLKAMFSRPKRERVVTVHEKNPRRIELLNEWVHNTTANNVNITWNTMRQSSLSDEYLQLKRR